MEMRSQERLRELLREIDEEIAQDRIDLTSPELIASLDFDLLEQLVYNENEARASSLTPHSYRTMVTTYEKEYKPKAIKLAAKVASRREQRS